MEEKSTKVGNVGQYCPIDQRCYLNKKFIPSKDPEYLTIAKSVEKTYIIEQFFCVLHDEQKIIGIKLMRDPITLEFIKDTEIYQFRDLSMKPWIESSTKEKFLKAYEQVDLHFKNLLFT